MWWWLPPPWLTSWTVRATRFEWQQLVNLPKKRLDTDARVTLRGWTNFATTACVVDTWVCVCWSGFVIPKKDAPRSIRIYSHSWMEPLWRRKESAAIALLSSTLSPLLQDNFFRFESGGTGVDFLLHWVRICIILFFMSLIWRPLQYGDLYIMSSYITVLGSLVEGSSIFFRRFRLTN